jgi:hypothetical protein
MSGSPAEQAGDLCPTCGSLLEPASGLEALVGFAVIERLDDSADLAQTPAHQRIAGRVDEFMTRRGERLDQERLDDEPWPEALEAAVALALTQPIR